MSVSKEPFAVAGKRLKVNGNLVILPLDNVSNVSRRDTFELIAPMAVVTLLKQVTLRSNLVTLDVYFDIRL